ncbi:ankyrin repeat domain-containing protein [Endozoicomonas ascidiicola]|uniref:ankyrin repeat domain-containing protein n=1 Tax=Endozoicomonas ascidiicola TaxID=1698521 RepID=UPI000837656A|nr:ankyrin repeat domain-containing protein [Endozoicomonas ascidiicola]
MLTNTSPASQLLYVRNSAEVVADKERKIRFVEADNLINGFWLKRGGVDISQGFFGPYSRRVSFSEPVATVDLKPNNAPPFAPVSLRELNPATDWSTAESVDRVGGWFADGNASAFLNTLHELGQENRFIERQRAAEGAGSEKVSTIATSGAGSDECYLDPDVQLVAYCLAVIVEMHVYKKVSRHDERIEILAFIKQKLEESLPGTNPLKPVFTAFFDNAMQTEKALFQLSCDISGQTFIQRHHDELCGFYVDESSGRYRHLQDIYPYHAIKMVNGLSYVLTVNINTGLCLQHLEQISHKLGDGGCWSENVYQKVAFEKGEYSQATMESIIKNSVIICSSLEDRKNAAGFIRRFSNVEAVMADRDNAKKLLQVTNYKQAIKIDPKDPSCFFLASPLSKQDKKAQLTELVDGFNCAVQGLKNGDLPSQQKETALRKEIVKVLRQVLAVHPFQSGNTNLVSLLDVLLCRIAGVRYIKMDAVSYLLFPDEALLAMQSKKINRLTSTSGNPLFNLIECEAVNELKVVLDSGAKEFINRKQNGVTPLMQACLMGNARMVDALLKNGADTHTTSLVPKKSPSKEESLMTVALTTPFSPEIIELLLASKIDLDNSYLALCQYQQKMPENASAKLRGLVGSHLANMIDGAKVKDPW